MQSRQDFGGSVLATDDDDWGARWATPEQHWPHLTAAGTVAYGKKVSILIFFVNPAVDAQGSARLRCDVKMTSPAGKVTFKKDELDCFSGKLMGNPYNIRLSAPVVTFRGEPGDPPGK